MTAPKRPRRRPTRTRRVATVVRASLATVAVIGVAAAATTALWTDSVVFGAEVGVADGIDLRGRVGTTGGWSDEEITVSLRGNIYPTVEGEKFKIQIQNIGDVDAVVTATVATQGLSAWPAFEEAVTVAPASGRIPAGGQPMDVDVTLATRDMPQSVAGASDGKITITFSGRVPSD